LGFPDLFGLLDLSFWALEVSGVIFLPPKGGFGLFNLSQVMPQGGFEQSRGLQGESFLSEKVHGLE